MKCPRCNVEMVPGKAIDPAMKSNTLYEIEIPNVTAKTLRLIDVLKCPECGHSEDGRSFDR